MTSRLNSAANRCRNAAVVIVMALHYALIGGIVCPTPAAGAELRKLTVPYTPLTGASSPLWIAIEGRIFQKYGLEITPVYVSGSNMIVAAMSSGQFEIAGVGGGSVVLNRFGGAISSRSALKPGCIPTIALPSRKSKRFAISREKPSR